MPENRQQLIEQTFDAMGRIREIFRHGYGPLFAKHGWGKATFRTLFDLAAQPQGATIKDLAAAAGVTPGAISQMVEHLHRWELVERIEDPADRRQVRVKLTKLAQDKMKKIKQSHHQRVTRVFEDLTDAEIGQLADLISRLKIEQHEGWTSWRQWREHGQPGPKVKGGPNGS